MKTRPRFFKIFFISNQCKNPGNFKGFTNIFLQLCLNISAFPPLAFLTASDLFLSHPLNITGTSGSFQSKISAPTFLSTHSDSNSVIAERVMAKRSLGLVLLYVLECCFVTGRTFSLSLIRLPLRCR